jgi:Domain of unknown function (DUF1844)
MNDNPARDPQAADRFAQLVMQQTNMALMLLGQIANPNTGETLRDPEAARFFIDVLEMLEVKTRGNLTRDEEALLKQNLMALRLAFVEAVNAPAAPEKQTAPDKAGAAPEKK